MCTPAFLGLKEKYGPHSHLTVATSWDYQAGCLPSLLRNNPHIDQVVRVEPHEFATGWMRAAKWEFRGVPNDHIPDCVQHTDLVIELAVICAITETAQMQTPQNVTDHRTDIWCRAADVSPSSKRPILCLTREEMALGREWCSEHLGEGVRVGLPLKTMSDVRSWPYTDGFARDLRRSGYKVVTIDQTRRVDEAIPALIGKPIRFVAAVIAHLDAVVTPDTGILHVAGAMGTPIVGLFGSTNGDLRMRNYCGTYTVAERLTPCGPCWYRTPCLRDEKEANRVVCMKRITPDLVMYELECLLERFNAPERRRELAGAA